MKELAYLNKYLLKYKYQLLSGILLVFLNTLFATLVAPIAGKSFNLIATFIETYKSTVNPIEKEAIFQAFRTELLISASLILRVSNYFAALTALLRVSFSLIRAALPRRSRR